MASIVEDEDGTDISLFVYNNDNLKESSSAGGVKSHRNEPIVFETIPDNRARV